MRNMALRLCQEATLVTTEPRVRAVYMFRALMAVSEKREGAEGQALSLACPPPRSGCMIPKPF
jgi:hypothetical protein